MIRMCTWGVLVCGAFIAPWWVVLIGCILCIFVYDLFLEALIPALIIDVIYGAGSFMGLPAIATFTIVFFLFVSFGITRYIRGHVRV